MHNGPKKSPLKVKGKGTCTIQNKFLFQQIIQIYSAYTDVLGQILHLKHIRENSALSKMSSQHELFFAIL